MSSWCIWTTWKAILSWASDAANHLDGRAQRHHGFRQRQRDCFHLERKSNSELTWQFCDDALMLLKRSLLEVRRAYGRWLKTSSQAGRRRRQPHLRPDQGPLRPPSAAGGDSRQEGGQLSGGCRGVGSFDTPPNFCYPVGRGRAWRPGPPAPSRKSLAVASSTPLGQRRLSGSLTVKVNLPTPSIPISMLSPSCIAPRP